MGIAGPALIRSVITYSNTESFSMCDKMTVLARRQEQISLDIQALVDQDVRAVLNGERAGNSQEVVNLTQEINILSAAIERLRNAG